MKKNPKSPIKIELKSLNDTRLFNDVVLQLEKDINLTGIGHDGLKFQNPSQCLTSLYELIKSNLIHNPENVRSLLYRVDLDEAIFNQLLHSFESEEKFLNEVVKLVLMRELQKVINRGKY